MAINIGGVSVGTGGGGYTLGPETNTFGDSTTADQTAAEALRDTFATGDADWLGEYNGNRSFLILLQWNGGSVFQRRNTDGDDWETAEALIKGAKGDTGPQGILDNLSVTAHADRVELTAVSGSNTEYVDFDPATSSAAGLMLPAEKTKLGGVDDNAADDQTADEILSLLGITAANVDDMFVGATIAGTTLTITQSDGGTFDLTLPSGGGGTTDGVVTAAALGSDNVLTLTVTGGDDVTVDLSSLSGGGGSYTLTDDAVLDLVAETRYVTDRGKRLGIDLADQDTLAFFDNLPWLEDVSTIGGSALISATPYNGHLISLSVGSTDTSGTLSGVQEVPWRALFFNTGPGGSYTLTVHRQASAVDTSTVTQDFTFRQGEVSLLVYVPNDYAWYRYNLSSASNIRHLLGLTATQINDLFVGASIAGTTLTITQADGGTFDLTLPSGDGTTDGVVSAAALDSDNLLTLTVTGADDVTVDLSSLATDTGVTTEAEVLNLLGVTSDNIDDMFVGASIAGTTLTITQADGGTFDLTLPSSGDSTTDGVVSAAALGSDGTLTLTVTGADDVTVDLSSLQDQTESEILTLLGVTADNLDDMVTGASVSGTTLTFNQADGGSFDVTLPSGGDSTTDGVVSAAALGSDGTLTLTVTGADDVTVDLSSLQDQTEAEILTLLGLTSTQVDDMVTGASVSGQTLTFNQSDGGSFDVTLPSGGTALTDDAVLDLVKETRTSSDRGLVLAVDSSDENALAFVPKRDPGLASEAMNYRIAEGDIHYSVDHTADTVTIQVTVDFEENKGTQLRFQLGATGSTGEDTVWSGTNIVSAVDEDYGVLVELNARSGTLTGDAASDTISAAIQVRTDDPTLSDLGFLTIGDLRRYQTITLERANRYFDYVSGVKPPPLTTATVLSLVGDDGIASSHIADDAVGADQIADDAVGSDQIADDAVGADQIADDAVVQAAIADDAVGADQIASASVVPASISASNTGTVGQILKLESTGPGESAPLGFVWEDEGGDGDPGTPSNWADIGGETTFTAAGLTTSLPVPTVAESPVLLVNITNVGGNQDCGGWAVVDTAQLRALPAVSSVANLVAANSLQLLVPTAPTSTGVVYIGWNGTNLHVKQLGGTLSVQRFVVGTAATGGGGATGSGGGTIPFTLVVYSSTTTTSPGTAFTANISREVNGLAEAYTITPPSTIMGAWAARMVWSDTEVRYEVDGTPFAIGSGFVQFAPSATPLTSEISSTYTAGTSTHQRFRDDVGNWSVWQPIGAEVLEWQKLDQIMSDSPQSRVLTDESGLRWVFTDYTEIRFELEIFTGWNETDRKHHSVTPALRPEVIPVNDAGATNPNKLRFHVASFDTSAVNVTNDESWLNVRNSRGEGSLAFFRDASAPDGDDTVAVWQTLGHNNSGVIRVSIWAR